MENKEKVIKDSYTLYNLSLFETKTFTNESKNIEITRVPGGWIVDGIYIPFNVEFQNIGNTTTDIKIKLFCNKCANYSQHHLKFNFQKGEYLCPECLNIIIYNKG